MHAGIHHLDNLWSILSRTRHILFSGEKACRFLGERRDPSHENVKGYNKAMGKLWCVFSLIFILLGLPLLAGQNAAIIIVLVLGIVFEMIGTMIVYTRIEEKYRVKGKK